MSRDPRFEDVVFLSTPEGQLWLEAENRKADRERAGRAPEPREEPEEE